MRFCLIALSFGFLIGCAAPKPRPYPAYTLRVIVVDDEKQRDALCRSFETDWLWDDGTPIRPGEVIDGLFFVNAENEPTIIIPSDDPDTIAHEMNHFLEYMAVQQIK